MRALPNCIERRLFDSLYDKALGANAQAQLAFEELEQFVADKGFSPTTQNVNVLTIAARKHAQIALASERLHGNVVLTSPQPYKSIHEVELHIDVRLVLRATIKVGPLFSRKVERCAHQRSNLARIARSQTLTHTAHHEQVIDRASLALASLDDLLVRHDPLTGNVPASCLLLTPRSHLASRSKLLARQRCDTLQSLIAKTGIFLITRRVGQLIEVVLEPGKTTLLLKASMHGRIHLGKVNDVIRRVLDLRVRQGTLRPIRKRIRLLQVNAANRMNQCCIADLQGMTEKGCGYLGVKHRLRKHANLAKQDLQILTRGVEELYDGFVLEKHRKALNAAYGEGINNHNLIISCKLQKAKFCVISLFPEKLGVYGQNRRRPSAFNKGLKVFLGRYVLQDVPYVQCVAFVVPSMIARERIYVKLLVINNLISGYGDGAIHDYIRSVVQDGDEVVIRSTDGTSDTRKFLADAKDFDLVIASGGDGTVATVMYELAYTGIPVLPFPAGTANLLAMNLSSPTEPHALAKLTREYSTLDFDLGEIEMATGEKFGFSIMAGAGYDATIMKGAAPSKKSLGPLAYFKAAITNPLPQFSKFTITVDGERIESEGVGVLVINFSKIHFDISVVHENMPRDGVFDIAVLNTRDAFGLIPAVVAGLLDRAGGYPDRTDALQLYRGREITVEADPPLQVQYDGEVTSLTTPFTIRMLPKAARFAVSEECLKLYGEAPAKEA